MIKTPPTNRKSSKPKKGVSRCQWEIHHGAKPAANPGAMTLDHRSLNIDTFDPIYVLMGHALPEEAQPGSGQGAGDAQAGVDPQVSN
jgi:hypothetical protein